MYAMVHKGKSELSIIHIGMPSQFIVLSGIHSNHDILKPINMWSGSSVNWSCYGISHLFQVVEYLASKMLLPSY